MTTCRLDRDMSGGWRDAWCMCLVSHHHTCDSVSVLSVIITHMTWCLSASPEAEVGEVSCDDTLLQWWYSVAVCDDTHCKYHDCNREVSWHLSLAMSIIIAKQYHTSLMQSWYDTLSFASRHTLFCKREGFHNLFCKRESIIIHHTMISSAEA